MVFLYFPLDNYRYDFFLVLLAISGLMYLLILRLIKEREASRMGRRWEWIRMLMWWMVGREKEREGWGLVGRRVMVLVVRREGV